MLSPSATPAFQPSLHPVDKCYNETVLTNVIEIVFREGFCSLYQYQITGLQRSKQFYFQAEKFGRMDPDYSNSFEDSHASESGAFEYSYPVSRPQRKLPPLYAKLLAPAGPVPARPVPTAECSVAIDSFKDIMAKRLEEREKEHPSYKVIPQFFFRKVRASDCMQHLASNSSCGDPDRKQAQKTRWSPACNGKQTDYTCCDLLEKH